MTGQETDRQLLLAAAGGSRDALELIARRYVGFVYNAALRQMRGDAHLAEDVTQAVFVILVGKIRHLHADTLLHGWFFTATRYAAHNALKVRARTMRRERQAAAMRHETIEPSDVSELAPLLDEALAHLRETDRGAVLLSYFAGKNWHEVGSVLGISSEAARKRVERSIGRLRQFFNRRGIGVSAAGLVGAIRTTASAAAAPAHLFESITLQMSEPLATGSSASAIAKSAIHMMTWAKVKLASAVAATMLLAIAGATGAAMLQRDHGDDKPSAFVANLDNDTSVELLGVAKHPSANEPWWRADGSATKPVYAGNDGSHQPTADRELVLRITGPNVDDLGVRITLASDGWSSGQVGELPDCRIVTLNAGGKDALDLRITLATGAWETVASQQGAGLRAGSHVIFGQATDQQDGGCALAVSDDLIDQEARVVAVGHDGSNHLSTEFTLGMTDKFRQINVKFDLAVAEIDHFEFQSRPYDQWVLLKGIALNPGKSAGFKIESGKTDEPKRNADK